MASKSSPSRPKAGTRRPTPELAEAGGDDGLPHYLGHRDRLRERFLNGGRDALADYELLELLLFMAIPRRDTKPLAKELIADGIPIEHLDLGGGLGISYDGSPAPTAADYAATVLPIVRDSGLPIVLEPGRHIIGPSGALLTRVVDVKPQPGGKLFVILDAGMTELIRPMLYNAYHRIEPVERRAAPEVVADVVGPLCESSDTLGKDRRFPHPHAGDLFAVLDAGAYGSVMASNYNRRTLPAEVMVAGGRASIIRRRQTIDDMLALEL